MIDAGYDDIRIIRQVARQRQMHAVRRRAVDEIAILFNLADPERRVQRQRVAGTAVIPVRRHQDDLGNFGQRFCERDYAPRHVAVIVTHQNFHCLWIFSSD